MSKEQESRRDFLKTGTTLAAAGATLASVAPHVHAGNDSTVQIALVGAGGRGTGAAANALSVKDNEIKLTAMADVFENKLAVSHNSLKAQFEDKVQVADDSKFLGFDGYKKAIDTLNPGDIVILTTPPAFRWLHYTYAIEKGVNVFMEKPVTVDGPSSRKMFALNEKAKEKNLKVGVGLMCRHCKARRELFDKIQDGVIGDITQLRAYRMAGPTGSAAVPPQPEDWDNELLYQIRHIHGFLWASGGAVSDFLIHNIDEMCWMKNDWPVEAKGSGGRHYRGNHVDQNFDTYSVEFTFADGTKAFINGRTIPGCHNEFATYAHGTKGSAIVSSSGHAPSRARLFSSHNMTDDNLVWSFAEREPNPYQEEWIHLIDAIRNDKEYNEVDRGVKSSIATSMARMAAHTGQVITYDDLLNCEHEFAPNLENMDYDSEPPVVADANGKYPIPLPGIVQDREY